MEKTYLQTIELYCNDSVSKRIVDDVKNYKTIVNELSEKKETGEIHSKFFESEKIRLQDELENRHYSYVLEERQKAERLLDEAKTEYQRKMDRENSSENLLRYMKTKDKYETYTDEEVSDIASSYIGSDDMALTEDELNNTILQLKKRPAINTILENFNKAVNKKKGREGWRYFTEKGLIGNKLEQKYKNYKKGFFYITKNPLNKTSSGFNAISIKSLL